MLRRNIRLIDGQQALSEKEVYFREITHFQSNFALMATVAALFAGFEFTVFGLAPSEIGEYSKLHASSIAYMLCATASLCTNIVVVCLATLASMLGPGLALRGPDGSVKKALAGMRREHDTITALFFAGSYSFFVTVIALVWFEYYWIVAAPVSFIVVVGACALYRGGARIEKRFAIETDYCGDETSVYAKAPSAASLKTASTTSSSYLRAPTTLMKADHVLEHGDGEDDLEGGCVPPLERRGTLLKRGHVRKNWLPRFFEVKDGQLTYYESENGRMLRAVRLAGARLRCAPQEPLNGAPNAHTFALTLRDAQFRLDLCANDDDDVAAWILVISRNSNACFTPTPLRAGRLDARRNRPWDVFRAYDARLVCSTLTLAVEGADVHVLVVVSAKPWDGAGRTRTYPNGILLTDEKGGAWQLCAASSLDRDAWLTHLSGCCGCLSSRSLTDLLHAGHDMARSLVVDRLVKDAEGV